MTRSRDRAACWTPARRSPRPRRSPERRCVRRSHRCHRRGPRTRRCATRHALRCLAPAPHHVSPSRSGSPAAGRRTSPTCRSREACRAPCRGRARAPRVSHRRPSAAFVPHRLTYLSRVARFAPAVRIQPKATHVALVLGCRRSITPAPYNYGDEHDERQQGRRHEQDCAHQVTLRPVDTGWQHRRDSATRLPSMGAPNGEHRIPAEGCRSRITWRVTCPRSSGVWAITASARAILHAKYSWWYHPRFPYRLHLAIAPVEYRSRGRRT